MQYLLKLQYFLYNGEGYLYASEFSRKKFSRSYETVPYAHIATT